MADAWLGGVLSLFVFGVGALLIWMWRQEALGAWAGGAGIGLCVGSLVGVGMAACFWRLWQAERERKVADMFALLEDSDKDPWDTTKESLRELRSTLR